MKNLILIITCLLTLSHSLTAQELPWKIKYCRYDSVLYSKINPTTNTLELYEKIISSYNNNDQKFHTINLELDSLGNWQPNSEDSFKYNNEGLVSEYTNYVYDGANKRPLNRYEYTYNANGKETIEVYSIFNVAENTFKLIRKSESVYDGNKLIAYSEEVFETASNTFIKNYLYLYNYTSFDSISSILTLK